MDITLSTAITPVVTLDTTAPGSIWVYTFALIAIAFCIPVVGFVFRSKIKDTWIDSAVPFSSYLLGISAAMYLISAHVIFSESVEEKFLATVSEYGDPGDGASTSTNRSWLLETEDGRLVTCETFHDSNGGDQPTDLFVLCSDPATDGRIQVQEIADL